MRNLKTQGRGRVSMAEITRDMIEAQFYESLRACGITPRESLTLEMDGQIHRFATENDKSGGRSGAYVIHTDGRPCWGCMDYHIHHEMQKFKFNYSVFSSAEKLAYMKERDLSGMDGTGSRIAVIDPDAMKRKQAQEAQELEARKQAILSAWKEYVYPQAVETDKHPYIKAKGLMNTNAICFKGWFMCKVKQTYSEGDICKPGELLIPLVDATTGVFSGLQRIYEYNGKFEKRFYQGTSPKGCACELFPYDVRAYHDPSPLEDLPLKDRCGLIEADEIFVCEGVATGFSVLELTGNTKPVLCSMSAGNLLQVCKAWKERYPKMKIVVCADNDTSNVGQQAAFEVLKAGYADDIKIPPTVGDWNDFLISTLKGGN